jgi:hypothetical protein
MRRGSPPERYAARLIRRPLPPVLGRVADVNGYGASYLVAAGIQVLALPFVLLARREHALSDPITVETGDAPTPA